MFHRQAMGTLASAEPAVLEAQRALSFSAPALPPEPAVGLPVESQPFREFLLFSAERAGVMEAYLPVESPELLMQTPLSASVVWEPPEVADDRVVVFSPLSPPYQDEAWSRLGLPRLVLSAADPAVSTDGCLQHLRFIAQICFSTLSLPRLKDSHGLVVLALQENLQGITRKVLESYPSVLNTIRTGIERRSGSP